MNNEIKGSTKEELDKAFEKFKEKLKEDYEAVKGRPYKSTKTLPSTYELYAARYKDDKNWLYFGVSVDIEKSLQRNTIEISTRICDADLFMSEGVLEFMIEECGENLKNIEIIKIKASYEIIKE